MRGDDAFAVLGLRPGAGRAEIDQAYRRLIKRYHPDYAGGDSGRAAELNQAYSQLRSRAQQAQRRPAPPPGAVPRQLPPRKPTSWRAFVGVVVALGGVAVLAQGLAMTDRNASWQQFPAGLPASESRASQMSRATFSMEEPLATELIDRSVRDAMRLHAAGDPVVAAEFTRLCLTRLTAKPSVQRYDSCAAYDEALAILAADDPAFQSGPFSPSAVTARQIGGARLLYADYLEAESRLQQIRSRVHLLLLPQVPDPAQQPVSVSTPVPVEKIAEGAGASEAIAPRRSTDESAPVPPWQRPLPRR